MPPLVSILIPCHNAERWIGGAIESALAQTWAEKEVWLVDDGSTDRSLEVIKSFGDRIHWEARPHLGGNPARNRLLQLARGEWLQYLDADDYLLPDKVSNQMRLIGEHSDADIIFGPVTLEFITENKNWRELLPIHEPRDLWVLLARWYLPQTGAPLWRRQTLLDAGGWKPDQPCCQEHELYLRLLMAEKRFVYCEQNGAVYRQWSEGTVSTRDKPEVRRRRGEILQRAEDFLRAKRELTLERLWAINMARFEMARLAWQHDQREALDLMDVIAGSQPDFIPAGAAAPAGYRWVLQACGFRLAEIIAGWRRRVTTN